MTSEANPDSCSTMVFRVSLSSRISPRTSTSMVWVRSPEATAVATRAMLRTWVVRLPAIRFTESVRSFQVPATPGTFAWPPRMPSLPTSRATRVTSSAKPESWFTMVFRVVFSSSSSPRTSTVICRVRSPRATAVATWAMSRTWPVRLPAIRFTESVRSFQVPAAPGTSAWPPSRPSLPISPATLVTSEARVRSVRRMSSRVRPRSARSPRPSTTTCCDRSPWAIAASTRPVSSSGRARSSSRTFTVSRWRSQSPAPAPGASRCPSVPSRPTAAPTRSSSAR